MHHHAVFERSLQKTNEILNDIEEYFSWFDHNKAYLAFRAVLHTLRDRLPVDVAVSFAAQLPLILKGVYFDSWRATGKPIPMNRLEFTNAVDERLHPPYGFELDSLPLFEPSTEEIIIGVLSVIEDHIDPAELEKIRKTLPKDIIHMLDGEV